MLYNNEGMQRLNSVWAKQETLRIKAGLVDAVIHNGIKYKRMLVGPHKGKLASQGTIVNIDVDDYVEYRVITKPSIF